MATRVNEFLKNANPVSNISGEDYKKTAFFVKAAKAFARNTHQCVYIIDYIRQDFIYVSENLTLICGEIADKIMEMGYGFYVKYVPEEEQDMLMEINNKCYELFKRIPIERRLDYIISYDFHIVNGRKKRLVHHHLTPMVLAKSGQIWLALCTISIANRSTPGNLRFMMQNSSIYYEYAFQNHRWVKKEDRPLNEAEQDVLTLSVQGYTMKEIADMLCKSLDTIKGYKRSLFSKLHVRSISEALSLAINYRLL